MPKPEQQLADPKSPMVVLIAAAVGAVVFMVIAGALVYGNTRKLISAGDWVDHTQEVLSSLQRASLLSERIEYRTRSYLLTSDVEQLNLARTSVNQFETSAVHLKMLVSDNENQTANVQGLMTCAADLTQTLSAFNAKSALPEGQIQRCQQAISLMTELERRLLTERHQISERSSFASLATEMVFVSLALVTLIILFGFLLRDAVLRQRSSGQMSVTNERLAKSVQALEESAQETELLTGARDELQLCMDVHQVYHSASMSFSRLLLNTSGSLSIISNSRNMVEVLSSWGEAAVADFDPPESCCGLRSGQPRWREPGISEIHCTHFVGRAPERYLCLPIAAHGNTLGVLCVQCQDDETVRSVKHRTDGLRQLLQLTGMAVASLNLRSRLENQSIRDPLTGLFNRRFMQLALQRELSRSSRRKDMLALFMIDVDHFKQFNDTYGHAAGDAVLRAVADVYRTSVRAEDIICRYGGEEFTIILPDTTPAGAFERAEAVRKAVAALRVPLETETYGGLTISIGVAFYPDDARSADDLLRRADQALYHAKRSGRNQVSLAETASAV